MAAFGLDALAARMDDRLSGFWVDALLIAEATSLSSFTNEIVKISVGRQRPSAHYGSGSQNADDNMSFYSGHTSFAFALAVSSGTVASMRDYRYTPLVWGVGLGVATATGCLSLASDRHYLTDVITSAVMGSAFGFAIPYFFHRPHEEKASHASLSVAPVDGGGLLTVSGLW
jgi:membrane-associated phospholipid phosphatase